MTPTARAMSYEAARDVERCCIECYRSDCDCKPSHQFPVIPESQTTTNERGGKQAKLDTAFDCISPKALRILAECLQFGKAKYGKDNCYLIDLDDHLAHAMNHITQYQCGDRSELHLVNAMARVMFALHMSIDQGDTPEHYTHPDLAAKAVERG